jgi:hypothetical protein
MTPERFKKRLARMTDAEVRGHAGHYAECRDMGEPLRDNFAMFYVLHPEWERSLCWRLREQTEDDRRTSATVRAATAAVCSAIAAAIAFLALGGGGLCARFLGRY